MHLSSIPIDKNWSFTQVGGGQGTKDGEWVPVANFPTTVHVELLKLGRIPDPFVGLNEWEVQWIGEAEWAFKCTFGADDEILKAPYVDLVFDGLDTYCTVQLNGKKILESSNAFVSHRVPSKDLLKSKNELVLTFPSTFLQGKSLEKEHGKFHLWNGDSSRLHIRKPQYNYGWDWGPVLMTVGPWKSIKIEAYETRISDFRISTAVDPEAVGSDFVKANISIGIEGQKQGVSATIKPRGALVNAVSVSPVALDSGAGSASFSVKQGDCELWYPVGYGKQPLYTFDLTIKDASGRDLHTSSLVVGFRNVKIVQDELEDGHTFVFEVNGVRIFCGGSNWIPADSFLTTMTKDRYKDWLKLLVDGNQNMIRVWGGGIYEHDDFYDLCDELGILVWQDFMFGCGQYPAYDSFVASVKLEAEQNVKRLRHHPSIAILAGNNEDYQLAESINAIDYSDEKSDFRKGPFPARYIYERVLPEVTAKHSDIFYHRSSPYSGFGKPTTDKSNGDLHQWNVWHGSQEPWHNWDILAGRFVSEFGMEGYPDIRTVDYWLGGDKSERFPQSRTNCNHNKADGFERRLELYLMENFKHAFDMESYVYYTQIMQAETLASAYRLWRRNWKGRGKEYTAGALVWQINDCWPVTSWAIVDYFLRPKPAYFAIKRELNTYTVGMTRKEKKTSASPDSVAHFTIDTVLKIWGTNSTLEAKEATLDIKSFDLEDETWTDHIVKAVTLAPNASTELWSGALPGQPQRTKLSEVPKTIVVSARLVDADGSTVLGRYSNWPEPFKYIHFPSVAEAGLKITPVDGGVKLECKKPIKGIVLDVEGEEVKWSDQAIDLVPGDPQTVLASGLNGRTVKARYLGDGSA
ncbi:glycoside hydrolase family 2 protein [Schizopora paradoxa]|uniref:beta-mannosidase n=1 Tax=Schizopora paradoxa TaxID=27342 RepID=A0A0H2RTR5_9AGAM|nr:glycoside hydrolase family 2 protein [Schizopora paradoxa]